MIQRARRRGLPRPQVPRHPAHRRERRRRGDAARRPDVRRARLGQRRDDARDGRRGEHGVCRNEGLARPKILAVTVLTSLSRDDLKRVGVQARRRDPGRAPRAARARGGMDGVVASPHEIARIRRECGRRLPDRHARRAARGRRLGRPEARHDAGRGDPRRRRLPGGRRPISRGADPAAAARDIVAEMERAFVARRPSRRRLLAVPATPPPAP